MAYEIPVTQARAELAELINRVVYGGERVVVTRHGKPLVALVSAADLRRLDELDGIGDRADHGEHGELCEPAEEQVVGSVSAVREVASAAPEHRRFGIVAEHRGANPS
ncbi:type II toxin-antitoxin system Phd/YefM family antitoxin [Streptomyces sp. NPDC059477]|uniref:type II toxin-antitoxin system Phd/YefM family antitoxin n=1 Tax=Streptomyces sp. NPDC059477 TaxID=3346847 RepID=UPI0036C6E85A